MALIKASRLQENDRITVQSTGLICVVELITYGETHDYVFVQYDERGRKCSISFRADEMVNVDLTDEEADARNA